MERTQKKVCRYFIQGYCKYQDKCFLYHPQKNIKKCFEFQETGQCKYGSKCYYSHSNPIPKYDNENSNSNFELLKNTDKTNEIKKNHPNEKKSEDLVNKIDETKENNEIILKHKPFIDFSKTELGKELLEKNKDLWGPEISYFDYLKTLKTEKDIEVCQIQRKYKSSFMWITDMYTENETKSFQIRHTPTIKREFVDLDFEIDEGFLWYEFVINWPEYPEKNSIKINLINNSIPNNFKKAFANSFKAIFDESKSIFKSLRTIDNNFDKICFDLKKRKNQVIVDTWSQAQQSALESAIGKYRSITDPVEKWNKIANDVPEKDYEACIKRFKECREKALSAKKEEQKVESESESQSENEESEDNENDEISENNEEEHKNNESNEESEEEPIIQAPKEQTLENEYNVYLNLVIKVNDLVMKQIGVINIEEAVFLVRCQKCKDEIEKKLTIHQKFQEYLYNDVLCANCNTSGVILFKKAFLHSSSNIFGKAGSSTWDILDILTVNLRVTCEQCNHSQIYEKYMVSSNINFNCYSCFKDFGFSYASYSLTYEEYSEAYKKKIEKVNKTQNKEETKINKVKKV